MNTTDLENILQKNLQPTIAPPPELERLTKQKMAAVVRQKSRRWLIISAVISTLLMLLEMGFALSFVHDIGLKLFFAGGYIGILCMLFSLALILSNNTLTKKELRYV